MPFNDNHIIRQVLINDASIVVKYDASNNKEELLSQMCRFVLARNGYSDDIINKTISGILTREQIGSTAIGQGIAIPHLSVEGITNICVGWFTPRYPIDFDSLDGEPVSLIFLLLAGTSKEHGYLCSHCLQKVARILKAEDRKKCLTMASTAEQFKGLLNSYY